MSEHWIPVRNSDRYLVSNLGNLFDLKFDRTLGQTTDRAGYSRAKMWVDGERKTVSVHRVVADSFYDVGASDWEVNHIDGDKANNHISNLELCTRSENMAHAYSLGLVHMPKETGVQCVETAAVFRTMREAARAIGASDHKSIMRVIDNPNRTAKGFRFVTVGGGARATR